MNLISTKDEKESCYQIKPTMKNNKIKYECSCFRKMNCALILAVEHTNGKDITNLYKYNKTNLSATIKNRNINQITGRKNKVH